MRRCNPTPGFERAVLERQRALEKLIAQSYRSKHTHTHARVRTRDSLHLTISEYWRVRGNSMFNARWPYWSLVLRNLLHLMLVHAL